MNLGAYIQVPFCQTKCTYCNFHTGVVARDRYQPYAAAVCREISTLARSQDLLALRDATIDTAYFGGGTPSLLEPAALANILDSLRTHFALAAHPAPASAIEPEITLEADPETITPEKAHAWRGAGFNRISLGAQSFDDRELQAAGRMHRRADIFAAAQVLRDAGFRNISMDLIAGLAHQVRESWDESVARLLGIRPEHISIYLLEIDEGSHLGSESLAGGSRYSAKAIPSDDAMAEFYDAACTRLAAAGYEHYEISNWGLPGLPFAPQSEILAPRTVYRLRRRRALLRWRAALVESSTIPQSMSRCIEQGISPREHIEPVTPQAALEEELFLGLRQLDGIDLARIERRYDVNLRERIAPLRRDGLVELEGTQLRLAPDRLTVSNEVFVELLGQGVERA